MELLHQQQTSSTITVGKRKRNDNDNDIEGGGSSVTTIDPLALLQDDVAKLYSLKRQRPGSGDFSADQCTGNDEPITTLLLLRLLPEHRIAPGSFFIIIVIDCLPLVIRFIEHPLDVTFLSESSPAAAAGGGGTNPARILFADGHLRWWC
jgi:hypothetical protein